MLLDAAKALVSAATSLQKLGDERRAKVATYFDGISRVLSTIPERKRKNESFADLCSELHVYRNKLDEIASRAVAPKELVNLVDTLVSAENIRGHLSLSLKTSVDTYGGMEVSELQEAAGLFRGLAATPSLFHLLRVAPAYGRIFDEPEGEIGNEQKIILSAGLAQQLFGGGLASAHVDLEDGHVACDHDPQPGFALRGIVAITVPLSPTGLIRVRHFLCLRKLPR